MLNQPSPLSLSSQQRCCSSLITLVACFGFAPAGPCPSRAGDPRGGCRWGLMGAEQRGRILSLRPSGHAASGAAQDTPWIGSVRCQRPWPARVPPFTSPQPQVLPGRAGARTEQQKGPAPTSLGGSCCPQCRQRRSYSDTTRTPALPGLAPWEAAGILADTAALGTHGSPATTPPLPAAPYSPSGREAVNGGGAGRMDGPGSGRMGWGWPLSAAGCARGSGRRALPRWVSREEVVPGGR